ARTISNGSQNLGSEKVNITGGTILSALTANTTYIIISADTTNGNPYFTVKDTVGVNYFRVLAAGTGTATEVRIGGNTANHQLRIIGNNNVPFIVDSGIGGVDLDTYVSYQRNSSDRWKIGKESTNDFVLL